MSDPDTDHPSTALPWASVDHGMGDDRILSDRTLRHLSDSGMLDAFTTPVFDRVVDQACRIFDCRNSMLTIIDQDNDRQFFKAMSGSPLRGGARQTSLAHSFCKFVVHQSAPLVICDATTDPRVAGHPAVGDYDVVAYLGVPIKDGTGQAIAALCLIESHPRVWTSDNIEVLQAFAEGVSAQIRQMFAMPAIQTQGPETLPSRKAVQGASLTYRHSADGQDRVEDVSDDAWQIWAIPAQDYAAAHSDMFALCLAEDYPLGRASLGVSAGGLLPWHHKWRIRLACGQVKWLEGYGLPVPCPDGGIAWRCTIGDVTFQAET